MDNSENYLINMRDGRVILFTKQAIRQVDYHPISHEVAMAIEDGRITKEQVIGRIKANLLNNQEAWDDLLKRKTTMNMRKSTLTPADADGIETAASQEDMKGAFDMPGEQRSAGDGEKPPMKPKTKTSAQPPPKQSDSKTADA